MQKNTLRTPKAFWIGSLILAFSSAFLAHAEESFQEIEIQGNNRIERQAILEKMTLRPGAALTNEAVKRDIQNIFSLGFFKDIQMEISGKKLIVRVVERPYVAKIQYIGSSEFEEKDLVEASKIKPFRVLSYSEIQTAIKAIQKKYEDKGYYLAQIRFEVVPTRTDGSEVNLTFNIQENEQVKIRKVYFLGNKKITSSELKQAMYTSETHLFSWATSSGTFRDDFFERDVNALAMYYGNEGYIEAKITKPRVTLSQDRRYIDTLVDIQEGEKFFLEDVEFKGDIIFKDEKLREALGMKPGDVFSTGVLQEGLLKLGDLYGDEGYAFANVIPKPEIKSKERKVALVIDIQKGEKIYWGEIKIAGNTKTHDKVIRRELKFVEGELTHATRRKKSLANLQRLGFFDEDIKFLTTTRKDQPTIMDLEIRVKEKPTGTLNLQAGYGNSAGFNFVAGVTQSNLFGRGQDISLQASWASTKAMNIDLGFTDPKIFDSDWLFGTNVFWSRRRVGPQNDKEYTYFQDSKGVSFRLGQEIAEYWLLAGRYRFSNTQLRDPISPLIFSRPDEDPNTVISSIGLDLTYDTRNNRLDPTNGLYFFTGIEIAGLGGRPFQQFEASARFYHKIIWKLIYRTRLEVGYIANFFDPGNVPDSERYILGGVTSLRGYDGGSIGSVKKLYPTRDGTDKTKLTTNVIGGTQKIVMNHELEFPLIPEANIRAVAFFDIGNAWTGDITKKSPSLLANYGWGIRWYSPMGPLRFEWGFPLADTEFNKKGESVFQFMIAPTF
jgi:outer membrane protein insertion porin family